MLHLEHVTKRFDDGTLAVDDVSLEISEGEIAALIGPSGAGKSTLIRCINRLVEPTGGEIRLGDVEVAGLGRRELRDMRRRIGMIFQEYALVERLTVMENILSGRLGYVGFWASLFRSFPSEDVERAFELLDKVDLPGVEDKRADELSGGQRQRVGIARALMQEPDLLLVDEPTAALDPKTSRRIMRLIGDLCREHDLTAIINIHDVPLARDFTERIIGLRDGALVFDGAPEALDDAALTDIYGEEDWEASSNGRDDGDDEASNEPAAVPPGGAP
jgi:phosphonate transport system ATP-binding protein